MNLVYNPVTKKLGSTENSNWYVDLKSDIKNIFSDNEGGILSQINNLFNDVTTTVNDIKTAIDSSGIVDSVMSVSNTIQDVNNNITNILSNPTLSVEDKTALIKLQKAISEGTLLKSLPLNANINDYQMITINNNVFYIKKNKTKQYIMYAIIILAILGVIIALKRGK